MVICSLDVFKKSSKKKETRIKKEIVEVLQQASYSKKRTGKLKIGMIKFLAFTLYLLARITLTLISFSAIFSFFKKKTIFRDLTQLFETLSCHMHSCMRHLSYSKNRLFYMEIQRSSKNQGQLVLCNKALHKSYQQINSALSFYNHSENI